MHNFLSHDNLQQFFQNAPEGVYVSIPSETAPFNEYIVWNARMQAITGYTQEEINSKGFEFELALHKSDSSQTFMPDDMSYEATYVTKDGENIILGISVETVKIANVMCKVGIVRNITSFKNYESILLDQAHLDPLTNIANRRNIMQHIDHTIVLALRTSTPFSLLMLDLDFFKHVNDTYGHATGDMVLCQSVEIMQSVLRPYDKLGRLSGEEFIIVLPGVTNEGAQAVGNRICQSMRKHVFHHEDKTFSVTISIGGTLFASQDNTLSIIKRADDNLYIAKRSGRDRVVIK